MRRPTFCNNSVAVEPPRPSDKEEGRLTKVKRMFTNSLRKPVVNKTFAIHIDELPVNKDHVPKVLNKMATYIETYGLQTEGLFRLSGGNPALVEQLKSSFNRTGDADLEACSDVASVASLLKLWLRDLPEPLITPAVTAELVTLLHKYGGEAEWCGQARLTLGEVPARNAATLQRILALLHAYSVRQPASAGALPGAFAPLLLCAEFHGISTPETTHVVARLIHDYPSIYCDKVVEGKPTDPKQRKRKERHNSDAASLDRKFVRSNSEERPSVEEKKNSQSESIRRVSSHEDFSRSHSQPEQHQNNGNYQPLHERNNWPAAAHSRHSHRHRPTNTNGLCELVESSPSPGYASDLFDENEHERRRHSERHAPRMPVPRTRRRKSAGKLQRQWSSSDDADGSSSKENEEEQPLPIHQASLSGEDESPVSHSTSSSSSHSFLQLHPQEKERSPSPVQPPTTPPLDLSTLHQQVDSAEPLTSRSFRHPQGDDRLVSPRNSIVMTRRVFAPDDSPQPDGPVSQMSKQIHSLKRKLRRYEEGFEKEFGYRPSHADKMSNPDTKKMCSLLTKLRREVKSLKEEGSSALGKVLHSGDNSDTQQVPQSIKEDAIHDVEKKLSEKRVSSGRPERVEEMTREQLVDEKLAVQKGLLYLENTFGRPTTKDDRDVVRPLYDRYRSLKRLLARNAASKLKDNVTELGTILEHETMDFTSSSPPPPTASPSPPCHSSSSPPSSPPRSVTPDLENLHAMPLSELLKQQQITREEKKRLRRSLREFEEECQKTMGRKLLKEDRIPMEQTYTEYKHAKAKLRLLEALLMKKK
ncbi:protein FAM13A isoform X2 [Homalodisca vitripennis]|nr:protein FAM13A isoform X2 [Homalodisca vitripennis]